MLQAFAAGLAAGCCCADVARMIGGGRMRLRHNPRSAMWFERKRAIDAMPHIAADLATALASGLRPVEALAHACKHRDDPLSVAATTACDRIGRGEDADVALRSLAGRFPDGRVGGLCLALETEIRSGVPALEPVLAVSRAASAAAAVRRTEKAARTAPLIQLVVALGLVPSALLIAAAMAISGMAR